MKLTVQHHKARSTDELDSLLEERIFELQARLQIDEARVRLECRRDASPGALLAGVLTALPSRSSIIRTAASCQFPASASRGMANMQA